MIIHEGKTLSVTINDSCTLMKMSDRRTETVMDAATALASLVSNKAGERSRSISPQGPKDDGASAIASALKPDETVDKQPQSPLPATSNPMLNKIGSNSNLSVAPNNGTSSAASRAKSTKFPIKLMNLLGMKEFEHIITWSDCGTMFTIHNPKNFVSEVLPQYFKQAKFTSFLRKLYRWGFAKRTDMEKNPDKESATYFHPKFQKGRLDLCRAMSCSTRGGATRDNAMDSMAASEQRHYFAHHSRPMIPDYNMNMGYFPGMMYGGGGAQPQHPNYNFHGRPMPPHAQRGNMFAHGMNGPGNAGIMNMNDSRNNPMMMERNMYNQDFPLMNQGVNNRMPNIPQQLQKGNNPSSSMNNPSDMGSGIKINNTKSGENMQNQEPKMDQKESGMSNVQKNFRDSSVVEKESYEHDQKGPQQLSLQEDNNANGSTSMRNSDTSAMRNNAMMMGNQANGMNSNTGMMMDKSVRGGGDQRQESHQMHMQGNHPRDMGMMGQYDQNGYYGQMQYPMHYPPPMHSYPPNHHRNNMMMPGHGGQMPLMFNNDSSGAGRQDPQYPSGGQPSTKPSKGE